MIPKRCTSCGTSSLEPLTWASISWNRVDGTRRALKHKLCVACIAAKLAPIQVACQEPACVCPACHVDTTDNYDAVYGSFIPKGIGKFTYEAPFCPPCAAHFRIWAEQGAEVLPDRSLEERTGASERTSATAVWDSLGLRPRER